jgi:hypothetical protein
MNGTGSLTIFHRALQYGVICAVMVGCAKDIPPPSVNAFVDNPILLEATMVRCAQNRSESKYTAQCVNAREAANRIAASETAARRNEMEAQSERKRQALRRTQEAAAEARQRAAAAEERRKEAELLGQFETVPGDDATNEVIDDSALPPVPQQDDVVASPEETMEETESAPMEAADLEAIREELRRRQEGDGQ